MHLMLFCQKFGALNSQLNSFSFIFKDDELQSEVFVTISINIFEIWCIFMSG